MATIRYISPDHNRDLMRRATRNGEFDVQRYSRLYCEDAVARVTGITPAMLSATVGFDETSDVPEAVNGEVNCTPELIWFLWGAVPAEVFQNPVIAASKELLRQVALEKKTISATSDG